MKFIHTSDWHIGKIIHEVNLIEDQKKVLQEFLNLIEQEKPDAILIAGDLYDRTVPSKEAVNLLDDILHDIIMIKGIPVLCIAGNHDSAERLEFGSRILERNGLFIEGKIKKEIAKWTFQDAYGAVHIYMIPFAYVSEIRYLHEEDTIKTFDDAFKLILQNIGQSMDKTARNVILTHGFIVSDTEEIEISDSVRPLSVGTTEYVDVQHFEPFDYTALGHLHKNQMVKWDHVRYSGSLLKYSFSEALHQKSVTVVEMNQKGDLKVAVKPLKAGRDMRKIEGKFSEIMAEKLNIGNTEDYMMVILTDEDPIYDAIGQLRTIYPNILRLDYKYRGMSSRAVLSEVEVHHERKSEVDLFREFYIEMSGKTFSEDKQKIVEAIFDSILTGAGELE